VRLLGAPVSLEPGLELEPHIQEIRPILAALGPLRRKAMLHRRPRRHGELKSVICRDSWQVASLPTQ
jgi:hypothetical protein